MAETPIGVGSFNTGTAGNARGSGAPLTKLAAKVSVDGLRSMDSVLKSIATSTEKIRKNFEGINAAGRSGGSVWSRILNRGATGPQGAPGEGGSGNWMTELPKAQPAGTTQRQGGAPPADGDGGQQQQQPGGGGNMMPWMARLGTAAIAGANILSNRIGRNIAESVPVLAQSSLLSSMYGMQYNQIEMDRFRDLGRYGGTRQEQMATQAMALRYGQTPQQASRFMQGVGNMTQAMGGTMTSSQAAATAGGFLDPLVLRKQIAQGMTPARVGGQVRDTMTVAQDYIKHFEARYNGGRKLNEFDFINLQTPGSGLRISFNRLYGLDDSSIDLIATAGMQTNQAGGRLDYGSSSAIAGMGMDRSRLAGAAASTVTAQAKREGSFAQGNESGMVTQLRVEETTQAALMKLESATSDLTSTFAALDKVIQTATTGLGMLLGGGMLMGGGGGFGGGRGGLLGRVLGGGGGGAGAAVAGAASAAPGGAPAAAAGGMGGMARAGLAAVGVTAGTGAIKTAVNARNWGDMFSAGAQGAVAGAAFGGMVGGPLGAAFGAAGGGVIGFGLSGINAIMGGRAEDIEEERGEAQEEAGNLTDKQIIEQFMSARFGEHGVGPYYGPAGHPATQRPPTPREDWKAFVSYDPRTEGLVDQYQRRRSALIAQFMDEMPTRLPNAFANLGNRRVELGDFDTVEDFYREWADISTQFRGFAATGKVDDGQYNTQGDLLIDITKPIRYDKAYVGGGWTGYDELNALYQEYFGNLKHPMVVKPIYTEHAIQIIEDYQYEPTHLALSRPPEGEGGDPTDSDGSANTSTNNYAHVARMPMAKPPNDKSWTGLDPRMKTRLLAMFHASGGKVKLGGGGGTRSTADQRAMFLSRYVPSPDGDIEWEGKKWKHVSGFAAAPPGRSMHEIGLAADLEGPMVGAPGWAAFVAKFGLREFSKVNNEAHHVQLAELPGSRRDYEAGDYDEATADTSSTPAEPPMTSAASFSGISGIGGSSLGALGLGTTSLSVLSGGGGGGGGGGATYQGTGGATTEDMSEDVNYSGEGPLTGKQIAQLAYNAGFRGENLIMAVAISKRESGWDPGAFNGNSNTGDKSYGLFQINMIGDLGPSRRKEYGIKENEELFDPEINMAAAFKLSSNGTDFYHWGGYKGEEDNYNTDMNEARSIVTGMGLGDAVFDPGGRSSSGSALARSEVGSAVSRLVGSSRTAPLNVNVTINSKGNYAYDAKQLAKHVRPAFEQEYAEASAKRDM